jgi:hypothetical protein
MSKDDYPEPTTVRDLWLMGETCGKYRNCVEYERADGVPDNGIDYREGMVVCHTMRVLPDAYADTVEVVVQRVEVDHTYPDGSYCPREVTLWRRTYGGIKGFRESPFWGLTLASWGTARASWDTRKLDDHDVGFDGDRGGLWLHYLKHRTDWLGNDKLSGEIGSLCFSARQDGSVALAIDGNEVFDGLVQDLATALEEYLEMKEKLETLKEHGVDLDEGTLSIRLWGDGDE